MIMPQNVADAGLSPREQLAADWRLFQMVEDGTAEHLYRVWEADRPVVVLGRSGRLSSEVDIQACERDDVEILRRFSGGGSVVLGPGCLNYAIGLSLVSHPALIDVASSFCFILEQIAAALGLDGLTVAGGTDVALKGRKAAGHVQRRGRRQGGK